MTPPDNHPNPWLDFLNNLPKQWVFKHLKLVDEGRPFVQAITNGYAAVVSDGSFKDKQGMAAWTIYDMWQPSISLGQGALTTPGSMLAQGSYQSKPAGIYSTASMVNALATYHFLSHRSMLIICNEEVTLKNCMKS